MANYTKHRLYNTWGSMKKRCTNPNSSDYYRYGLRGIKVCEKWKYFDNFIHDMEGSYKEGLTLDRIDNNGNYCKENCRWSSPIEQSNNTRRNRFVTYLGKTQTLSQWIRDLNLKSSTIRQRYYVYKWPTERLFIIN